MKSLATSGFRTLVAKGLHRVPVAFWRRLFPKDVVGFCYHAVSDEHLPHVKHYPVLSTREFEADLDYLQQIFDFISYEELISLRDNGSARKNAAILTFDDGFSQCAEIVAPILRRRGLNCIFFVITDLIDNRRMFRESAASLCVDAIAGLPPERVQTAVQKLNIHDKLRVSAAKIDADSGKLPFGVANIDRRIASQSLPLVHWLLTMPSSDEEVLEKLCLLLDVDTTEYLRSVQPYLTTEQIHYLQGEGFTVGAHSVDHQWLQSLTLSEAEREIVLSCENIRNITGATSVPFAFPYYGGDMDRFWLATLRERNETIGLVFDTDGLRMDEPFVVQRLFADRFGEDYTIDAILRRAWSKRRAWFHSNMESFGRK